jgi:hypothetical protein
MRLVEIVEFSGQRRRGELVCSFDAFDAGPRPSPPDKLGFDVCDLVCPTKVRDF